MYRPGPPPLIMNNNLQYPQPQPQLNLQWNPNPRARAPFYKRYQMNNNYRPPKMSGSYNEEHWCETCDRGFPNIDLLNKHKLQHQKCNIDGCQFIAHPKVITKHIQMQHSSGLYKRIAKLDNPEEIKKWREERKKKYPTKSNIEKKAAELKEKIDRGEKMGLKYDRHNRNFKPGEGTIRKHSFANDHQPRSKLNRNHRDPSTQNIENKKKHAAMKRIPQTLPIVDDKRKLKPFAGIQDMEMNSDKDDDVDTSICNDLIEDDYCSESLNVQETLNISDTVVCGALSSLICDYGSSDEDIEVEVKIKKNKSASNNFKQRQDKTAQNGKVNKNSLQNNNNQINVVPAELNEREKSDDDSAPEEVQVIKNEVVILPPKEEVKIRSISVKSKHVNAHKKTFIRPRSKLPSTLLQKLLCNEMQHERNLVLQCIRYIKKNNYYDKAD